MPVSTYALKIGEFREVSMRRRDIQSHRCVSRKRPGDCGSAWGDFTSTESSWRDLWCSSLFAGNPRWSSRLHSLRPFYRNGSLNLQGNPHIDTLEGLARLLFVFNRRGMLTQRP